MSDKGTIEQLHAELVQAREELVQAQTEIARVDKISDGYATGWADACAARDILAKGRDNLEKSRQFFIEMAEGRDKNLAQARDELKDLQGANRALGQQVAYVTKNRDYWYETALATEAERDEARKEAEGLRRQLAGTEVKIEQLQSRLTVQIQRRDENYRSAKKFRRERDEAVVQVELTEHIHGKLMDELATSKLERSSDAAAKLLERLATLDAAEAALADCGTSGIYAEFDGLADAIMQMAEHIKELEGEPVVVEITGEEMTKALQAEVRKRREAELAVHVLELREGLERQSVYVERAQRQEAEQRAERAEAALATERQLRLEAERRARELESSRDAWRAGRDSVTAELLKVRDWLEKAEQRAERAEALAALVNEETAALLERLSNALLTSCIEQEYRDSEAAAAHAARIREALGANDA